MTKTVIAFEVKSMTRDTISYRTGWHQPQCCDALQLEAASHRASRFEIYSWSPNALFNCTKVLYFYRSVNLIDIRTTKFLEKFTSRENLICSLSAKQLATENIQKYS